MGFIIWAENVKLHKYKKSIRYKANSENKLTAIMLFRYRISNNLRIFCKISTSKAKVYNNA